MTTSEASTDIFADIGLEQMKTNNSTPSLGPIVGHELRLVFEFVNRVIIGQVLAAFGMGSNIVNITVFCKMGFKESINVSLFGLAISDFMSCLTVAWANLCFTPDFQELDLPFDPPEIRFVTGGWPHTFFTRITACITAFITFERCLCVTFPLKVKNVITPKKVKIFLVCMSTCFLGLLAPIFYVYRLEWKFYPHLNKSRVGLVFSHDRIEVERWIHPITSVGLYWFFFTSTIICTVILVVNLKKQSEWRTKAATTSNQSNQVSSRDAKVATLVVFVAATFIACFTPQSMTLLAMSAEAQMNVNKRYGNIQAVIFSFNFLLESINASLNIFIYYFRSSKYKIMFQKIFFKKTISC